jgi:hypothetical protein
MSPKVTNAATAPGAYPAHEESDIVLKSGATLRLRPIRPEDAAKLLEFFQRLSPDSLYFRFFSVPRLDVKKADAACQVDYENTFGLVGETSTHRRRRALLPRSEAARAPRGRLHGRGRARAGHRDTLCSRLADIARAKGINLRASVPSPEQGNDRRLSQLRLRAD